VRSLMSQVDGVVDPRIVRLVEQPNVEIDVDLDKAQRVGIKPGDVRRAEATLVQGLLVGSVFEDQKVFEVVVQGTPETRRSVSNVRNLLLDRPGGGHVRLGEVADVRITNEPIAIARDAVSRYLDVEANVSGRSLDAVAAEIENRLQDSVFPLEYHAEVLTQTTGEEINGAQMLLAGIAAALGALLLLQAAFRSWRLSVLALLTLPVALVGGVLAALIDGAQLSVGSLLGFLALLGIAARNGIVLIRHLQDLERFEGETFGADLVRRGARERLGPILTTACALAAIALVFVILGSRPGLEIVSPMAVVILGGLVTTTLVSLFVLPALYLRFGGRQPTLSPEEELMQRWVAAEPAPAAEAPARPSVGAVQAEGAQRPAQPQTGSDQRTDERGEPGEPQPAV
jgi:Cu/Ag efflux pump CusA